MIPEGERAPPKSLLEGVEAAACAALGITNLKHRSALLYPEALDAANVVDAVYRTLADNYARGGASANKDRSQANWRWCSLQPQIAPHNRSPEVVLERAIAAACQKAGRTDWANQVPVASGLISGASDGRRAIDLVHRRGPRHFELIELKIASDTPLYAAVEIIGYGCLWLLARADRPARASDLLDADHIDLRVLAPAAYYDRFDLESIEASLDEQARALGDLQGVTLSFVFNVLPPSLSVVPMRSKVDPVIALKERHRLSRRSPS